MNIDYKFKHVPALDGLRGVAMLMVVVYHFFRKEEFVGPYLKHFINLGWVSIDMFFVLSGFLIGGILLETKGRKYFFRDFFVRRSLRVFPLYYGSIIILFTLIAIFPSEKYSYFVENKWYFWTYTHNILFAFDGWPRSDVINHFWTMAVEEQFYLVCPFVIYFLSRRNVGLICGLAIVTAVIVRFNNPSNPYSHVFTLARKDALAIGVLTAILIRNRKTFLEKNTARIFWVSVAILMTLFWIEGGTRHKYVLIAQFGFTLASIIAACLITSSYSVGGLGNTLRQVLGSAPLQFFGRYSYGIYIYHWILYRTAHPVVSEQLQNLGLPGANTISLFIALGLTVILSVITYHGFELPFLRLKSHFEGKSLKTAKLATNSSLK